MNALVSYVIYMVDSKPQVFLDSIFMPKGRSNSFSCATSRQHNSLLEHFCY